MAKKALIVILVALFSLGTVSGAVYAQDGGDSIELGNGQAYQPDQKLIEEYTAATENCADPSLECLVYYTTNYVAIQLMQNIVPINNVGSSGTSTQTPSLNTGLNVAQNQGVVPGLAYFIGQMYANPAASTPLYVADVLESAHLVPRAYAQGLGFGALNPILELWKTFRNIAYVFYVVIFIIIGFLIMFRKKVGQSAITAQQAIPNVIVSLLFVTFSYAIAGLLIDLMYLSMFLIVGIFQATFTNNPDIINYNIFELSATFIKHGAIAGFSSGSNIVESMINNIINNQTIASAFGWVGGITVGLVIAIAVLIGAFKLFFELLRSYAIIVLSVVVGPIQLMMGAFPGNDTFTPWIKNLVANLAAFPVVLITAVMFFVFTDGTVKADGGFMPPFLVGRGASDAIATLMGLAILLALPEIVKEIKKKMGATEGFGGLVANAAVDRGKQALSSGYGPIPSVSSLARLPGKAWEAQPFAFGRSGVEIGGRRLKTEGQETALERLLIGTRAARKSKKERMERQQDLGSKQIIPITNEGLAGLYEKRRELQHARSENPGPGSEASSSAATTQPARSTRGNNEPTPIQPRRNRGY